MELKILLNKNEHDLKSVIFSIKENKSNPFSLFKSDSLNKESLKEDSNMDYKMECAMEYELIYNSHFMDQ